MKWLYRKIKSFFKSTKAQSIPSQTTKPGEVVKQPGFGFIPVFMAVLGHNEYAQGTNYKFGKKESEWTFNGPVIDDFLLFLDTICPKIPAFKVIRPIGSYGHQIRSVKNAIKKITAGMQSYGMNLHFNSGGGIGSENLIAKGSIDNFDNIFADQLSDVLEVALDIPQRRDSGVFEIRESHNGGGMIAGQADVNNCTTIVEPVFDHDHDHARAIFNFPVRYAQILAETVVITYLIRGLIKREDVTGPLEFWDIGDLITPKKRI